MFRSIALKGHAAERGTIRDFKKFTSKEILHQIESDPESRREWMLSIFASAAYNSTKHKKYNPDNYRDWQTGSHTIELYSEKFVWDKINYIHQNPVKDNFVVKMEDWVYSSATNYLEMESVLKEVERLPQRLITY